MCALRTIHNSTMDNHAVLRQKIKENQVDEDEADDLFSKEKKDSCVKPKRITLPLLQK